MRVLIAAVIIAAAAALTPLAGRGQAAPAADDGLVLPVPKPGHARPLAVVVAGHAGAEVTDFITPYGVLKDSGLFEVRAVSAGGGAVQLFRTVRVLADQSLAQFDASAPEGADVVIVPAQMDPGDRVLIAWIRAQAAKGATIVSICEGARVLANAGLLEGRRATTHWHALGPLERSFPRTVWVRDRRYVQDGRIISTTGVSASLPVSVALVEAAGGRAAARRVAARMGLQSWAPLHRTAEFRVSGLDYARVAGFLVAFWTHDTVEIPVSEGQDEVALALRADAWTRSFRTRIVLTHAGRGPVRSLHGLWILPDDRPRTGRYVAPAHPGTATAQLDATLRDMNLRYGPLSVRFARLAMEYGPV